MMETSHRSVMLCLLIIALFHAPISAKKIDEVKKIYSKIGDELIGIRRQHAGSQPQVYVVLDQLDKMYNLSKAIAQRKHELKLSLQAKNREVTTLKTLVEQLKTELSATKNSLNDAAQKIDAQRASAIALEEDKKNLVNKMQNVLLKTKAAAAQDRQRAQRAENKDQDFATRKEFHDELNSLKV